MNKIFITAFFFSLFFSVSAQQLLTVEEAVSIALENNYQLQMASKEVEMAETGFNIGNAGMLPSLGGVAASDNSVQHISQTRSSGEQLEKEKARNSSFNYGVELDWTLFDGFRMFARYDQLKELESLERAEFQIEVLNTVGQVMITYFDLVQQQQQLKALDSTQVISEQRLEFAGNRFSIGKASKLEVLNAQVDLNTDKTELLRQKEMLAHKKIQLNLLLARDSKTDFAVIDEIPVGESLNLPELEMLVKSQNPLLQAEIIQKNIAEQELRQVRGGRYPTIIASTGYQFTESESGLGFTTNNKSRGWNYGLTARMNLFNGFLQKQNEQLAKLQMENTELAIEQQQQALISELTAAYETYLTNLSLIDLESDNQAIAKENLEITLEKFRIGTIPTIEFRTAQLNYINSLVRYTDARFQAKLSEIRLQQLAGTLSIED